MPKYLYHATFTKNVPSIKQKGLLQFQPSLWIKGPGGSRYNEEAGIFAFDDPEDALNWAGKMAWEFRDTDKDISIIRIDMEDEIWDDDPAEDPFVSNKGRALRSGANIKADRIIDAIRVDDLGKPGDLGISRDEWLAQVTPKLREGDMKADREAGIKYVDDSDWKRLHDMDDKIIQAYIDHKEPKEELTERMDIESDSYGGFNARYNKKPNERGIHDAKIHPPQHLKNEIAVKSLEASSLEELRRISHEWVDKARESFKPVRNWSDVTGSPTLDLNREFIRDELGVSAEHWIKITELDNGDIALLVAPDDAIADYGLDTVQGENYKRMTIKKTQQGELTNTAASGMSKVKAQRLKLTPNGRYTLHRVDRKSDSMGSDIFLMKYDSIVDDPNIPQRLGQPAVTIAADRKQLMNSAVLHEGINDPHIFKAVFMAGGPGSGKSYMSRAMLGGSGLKVVNTDQALEYLMVKHDLDPKMPDEEQADRDVQRGRAKELTNTRRGNYLDGRLGLIIDGTAKDYEKIAKAKKDLEDIGYETRMIFVNTNLETAQGRNMQRPERSVPEKLLNKGWKMAQENVGNFQMLFGRNDFYVIDNSENSENEDRVKKAYNSMQRWLATPVTNREALDWMDQQTGFSEGLATINESEACGDCFSKAGRAMINMTETQELYGMQMVHAYVYGQGKLEGRRFPHAWTEQGDMVLDNSNSNNIEMHKALYYKLGGVEEKPGAYATYNKENTMKKLLSTQKYGPWDLDDTLDEGKDISKSTIAKVLDEGIDSRREITDKKLSYQDKYPKLNWDEMPGFLKDPIVKGITKKKRNKAIQGTGNINRNDLVDVVYDALGEGDGRKKGIHPKGHPKRQAQQAAIHASESIFLALEKKSNST
jgi:hypothetical protein